MCADSLLICRMHGKGVSVLSRSGVIGGWMRIERGRV